ncbi:MAG: hypothetical protein FWD39_04840 [Clostridiales bacterium]|nr:hypothetical protein [Clostridiales bacterium]
MGNDADRVKLLVTKNWYMIILAIFFSGILVGFTVYFSVKFKEVNIPVLLFVVFAVIILTTVAVASYHTATLDKNGVLFKVAIWKIAYVKWTDIVKADVQDLATLQSSVGAIIGYRHIILYTDLNQKKPKDGGGNAKNDPPWQIIYNKKNAMVVKEYLKKYSNITLKDDVKKGKQKQRQRQG